MKQERRFKRAARNCSFIPVATIILNEVQEISKKIIASIIVIRGEIYCRGNRIEVNTIREIITLVIDVINN